LWRRLGDAWPRIASSVPLAVLRVLLTFHLVGIAWIFFRAKTIADAVTVLRKIGTNLVDMPARMASYPFTAEHVFGFVMIGLLMTVELLDERRPIVQRLKAAPVALRWGFYYLTLFGLLILGRWETKEFIYMQF
jgi:hypothetical protein